MPDRISIFAKVYTFIASDPAQFITVLQEHLLYLVLIPVSLAILVAVPLGILATRYKWIEKIALGVTSMLQTIPSLALLALMIVMGLGIGYKPAITALFLYSLLPILRNTFIGIRNVDPALKEAATGMGMTNMQRLRMVELPLAFSVIMAGIRTATVTCIGTGTLAAYVGAGGLGVFIVRGLQLFRNYMLIAGAVPAAVMALTADFLLGKLEYALIPRGLKNDNQ
ncbi:MAG TPA: ABC transporter permease [Oscillospiraceae bacterium]|nr:ABC transporter permease [Oscillospiraceae bacterium]